MLLELNFVSKFYFIVYNYMTALNTKNIFVCCSANMSTRQSSRFVEKREQDALEPAPTSSIDLLVAATSKKKKRKTPAQRVKDCRERMKEENPEKYQLFLEHCKKSSKEYRQNITDDKKVIQNVKAKLRMRAKRQRDKEQHKETPRKIRATQEEQRAKWVEQKRCQKEKMTPQKKVAVKKRRARSYQEKKMARLAENLSTKSTQVESQPGDEEKESQLSEDMRSGGARRKALSRAKSMLLSSPRKYAQTVFDLMEKSSPRQKKLFEAHSFSRQTEEYKIGRKVIGTLTNMKKRRSKKSSIARSLLSVCHKKKSVRASSRSFGVYRNTFANQDSKSTSQQGDKLFHLLHLHHHLLLSHHRQLLLSHYLHPR